LFITLVVSGIAMKRVFGLAQWLPPFHIAALFVLIGISLQAEKARRAARRIRNESTTWEEDEPLAWDEV
jgi:hypothetical protein